MPQLKWKSTTKVLLEKNEFETAIRGTGEQKRMRQWKICKLIVAKFLNLMIVLASLLKQVIKTALYIAVLVVILLLAVKVTLSPSPDEFLRYIHLPNRTVDIIPVCGVPNLGLSLKGNFINSVMEHGPAYGKLKYGDAILSIDNYEVEEISEDFLYESFVRWNRYHRVVVVEDPAGLEQLKECEEKFYSQYRLSYRPYRPEDLFDRCLTEKSTNSQSKSYAMLRDLHRAVMHFIHTPYY